MVTQNELSHKEAKKIADALAAKFRIGRSTEQRLMDREGAEVDKALAGKAPFRSIVAFAHEDGSMCTFTHAELVELNQKWVAIFTEHHGYLLYPRDELTTLTESVHDGEEDVWKSRKVYRR